MFIAVTAEEFCTRV